ncbi:MAG: hypothetical protein WAW87_10235 [Candidatus Ferrigenium altingense]
MGTDYTKYVLDSNPLLNDIISCHLLIENYLRREVAKELKAPDALLSDQGPSFSMLVNVAEALGVIEADLARVIRAVNTIRNRYAHRLGFEASHNQVEALLAALREMDKPFYMSHIPGSERELGLALASLAGWLECKFGSFGPA